MSDDTIPTPTTPAEFLKQTVAEVEAQFIKDTIHKTAKEVAKLTPTMQIEMIRNILKDTMDTQQLEKSMKAISRILS